MQVIKGVNIIPNSLRSGDEKIWILIYKKSTIENQRVERKFKTKTYMINVTVLHWMNQKL